MKTAELTGPALDWAVAKCEGYGEGTYMKNIDIRKDANGKCTCLLIPIDREYRVWSPSTNWSQGGPIIEREGITLDQQFRLNGPHDWVARLEWLDETQGEGFGPTPLIAAMRCYVASKLGDEVEVPDELR